MDKKPLAVIFLSVLFLCLFIFYPKNQEYKVIDIASPTEIILNDGSVFKAENFETFDSSYTAKNKNLASKYNLTEDETFILGNFAKYWVKNLLSERRIKFFGKNFLYSKFDYISRFENSAFCLKNGEFTNKAAFLRQLNTIRKGQYVILDIDTDETYPINKENSEKIKNYVIVRKTHAKKIQFGSRGKEKQNKLLVPLTFDNKRIKIIFADHTSILKPDRNCSSDICKELVSNINNSQKTIDMAIYGYSSVPKIEEALINAKNRGVKIRLVYDYSTKDDIYPETDKLLKLIPENMSDKNSEHPEYIMHNKFYIFDGKTVMTGSANLSHTDMSGFNSNSVIVIKSDNVAKIYEQEFEQMYSKNFHGSKRHYDNSVENMTIRFSPQDFGMKDTIIPLIKNAKNYIYVSAFIITEKNFAQELINAHKRGVEVKVIVDALNASNKYSRHQELRNAGIQVKTENYAGKMHSKSIITDDKYTLIGSMNFSKAGEYKNDENFVLLDNSDAAKFYKQFFLYQWNKIPEKWLTKNARAEGKDSIGSCTDGIDNDYDGLIDKEDEGCK